MAVLSEFFVGTAGDAAQAEASGVPDGLPAVRADGVDPVKVAKLDEILTGMPGRLPEFIKDDQCAKTLVAQMAPRVVERLAHLTAGEAAEAAQRWAQTKEWVRDQASPGELKGLLEGLSGLARQAESDERRHLYLWLSR